MVVVNPTLILIIQDLRKLNENYNNIINGKPIVHEIEPNVLNERVKELMEIIHSVRLSLLERKIIYELYPDMIQFGAFIFIIIDFLKYQIITYNHLLKLKSDKYHRTKNNDSLELKNVKK